VTGPSPARDGGAPPPARHGRDDRLIGIGEIRALFGLGRTAVQAEGRQRVRPARATRRMQGPDTAPLRISGEMRYARRRGASPDNQARTGGHGRKDGG
jgi:hypothetical protein